MSENRFPYKPKLSIAIFCTILFGFFSYFIGLDAITNKSGMVLFHIFEFSATGATVFLWFLTVLSAFIAVLGVLSIIKSIISNNQLIITDTYIQAPKSGISNTIVTVYFESISNITEIEVNKNIFFNLFHNGGKLTVVLSVLPNKDDFEYIKSHILSRVNFD